MDKDKYVVLTPYFGGRISAHLKCMRALLSAGVKFIEVDSCPYIDMAQSVLVENALEQCPKAEVFMFIEHDMVFSPEDVEKIIQHLLDSSYDAIGAAYSTKQFGNEFMVGKPINPDNKPITFYQPGIHPAYFLGFGFTAIRRKVFEIMAMTLPYVDCPSVKRKVHPFFLNDISSLPEHEELLYNGNDVAFYNRMRRLHMWVGIDLEIKVKHIGSYTYGLEDIGHTPPNYDTLTINFKG